MSKIVAETMNKLGTSDLKRYGFLRGGVGHITWTSRYSGSKTTVSIAASVWENIPNLNLTYTYVHSQTNEEIRMDYRVELTYTPCRFGGKRVWFICPMVKRLAACGRRVGVLYGYGQYFMCRHCCELAYESQNLSGRHKGRRRIISFPELEALASKVKRTHYQGKPTRNYRRYMQMNERGFRSFGAYGEYLKKRFKDNV